MIKCNFKKVISLMTSIMILFCFSSSYLSSNSLTASAICCRKDGFDKSRYTLTGNMAQDVATIAKSQAGRTGAQFGYTEAWCDEFVADCLENAGANSSIVGHGGTVADFESVMRSKGAVEVNSPKIGDLVFFAHSHVEIVTKIENGIIYCAGGNNGGTNNYKTNYCKGERKLYSTVRLYLRPNYPNKLWYENLNPENMGEDFYAQIKYKFDNTLLSNINGNAQVADEIGTKNQIWHFKLQNDGSYSIISYYDDLSLDVAGYGTDNGTNIQMMPYVGNTAQKFWIYQMNGAYYFQPQCTNFPFTINGINLELWPYDSTFENKKFDIIEIKSIDKVIGDCNNDGQFSVADILMLQKWLLNDETELTNWQSADLDENGIIDVFDLCLMKQELINK